jgi:hypothetical protein
VTDAWLLEEVRVVLPVVDVELVASDRECQSQQQHDYHVDEQQQV